MARIAGVNIPQNKVVHIALTYIHGIGKKFSNDICTQLNISKNKRANSLTDDEVLKIISIFRVDEDAERMIGYAKEKKNNIADFYIGTPFNKNDATNGNGTMISFEANTPEKVNEMHKKALELGAINEGDPGPRLGENYYAYFRDLDGNKICAFAEN